MKNHFDAVVVGSGHNGMTAACYLAKAGYRVCVLERRDTIGGAVCTETMFGSDRHPEGFKIDVGSSAHFMIHQTPVIADLELERYGLEYIDMDPFMSYPVPGDKGVIHFYRDMNKTLDSIASVAPGDVGNYREFISFWERINLGVLRVFLNPPSIGNMILMALKGQITGSGFFKKGGQATGLQRILSSYDRVVEEYFTNPHLKTALLWFAAQSGPVPGQSATGDFAGWQAMLHHSGGKRPKGGSGMLTQAMKSMLEAHGGIVRSNVPVSGILIRNGKAYGVRLDSGEEITGDAVISNAHVQTTMLKLVGPGHLKPGTIRQVKNIGTGNGFGMVIRCAVDELPRYESCPDDPEIHNGLQLICPSLQHMNNAVGDYKKRMPPERPAALAMTFSKIDPSLCPIGTHTLFVWAQWYPYVLANELKWDDIREREAHKIYDEVVRYAPNMKDKLIDWYIQTPLDIERKHGMLKGNVMHLDMTLDQMFMFRPTPEMSGYRTPVKNLYLSSASCHPGGGVFAAAGYNAARVVIKDLKKKNRILFTSRWK